MYRFVPLFVYFVVRLAVRLGCRIDVYVSPDLRPSPTVLVNKIGLRIKKSRAIYGVIWLNYKENDKLQGYRSWPIGRPT